MQQSRKDTHVEAGKSIHSNLVESDGPVQPSVTSWGENNIWRENIFALGVTDWVFLLLNKVQGT